jgi:hypothetical protein
VHEWRDAGLALPHVIEAALNHTIPGVAGVYRRHNFVEEKRDAMERLATLLQKIVEGSGSPGEEATPLIRGA